MPRRRPTPRVVMMDYVPTAQYTREDYQAQNKDVSDLCIKHIQTHLKSAELYHSKLTELLNTSQQDGVPALTTIAINSMINSLREDPSPSNFETVVKHAPESLLNTIIDSPKLHYTSMLRFAEQKGWDKFKDDSKRDIWILKNEYFIRADGTDWGLLNLDDADIVFAHSSKLVTNDSGETVHREITRKIAPKSGLQYLDRRRPRTLKIQPSTEAYKEAFDRLMGGALEGLDWNNIFVAGGMALSALLCVDKSMDDEYKSNDIDMYIYGLSPEEANEKIKHIAKIWKQNLTQDDDYIMVKNAKTVTLIGKYPSRRIQIILKHIKNPAAVLLNFDLDQVAIGYTGESVLFLPRCARALETGYSIFTLDMIHGHHLNERRETQEERLFKYAMRGFGVRILPEFCQMVEIDFSKRLVVRPFMNQALSGYQERRWYGRTDDGGEPDVIEGLKAVRRVFAAGEDMVHRFYLGRTEVSAPDDYEDPQDFYSDEEERQTYHLVDYTDPDTGETKKVQRGMFNALDTYRSGVGVPHGKRGLGSLEIHARHCALLRFEHEKKMIVEHRSLASLSYDTDSYDMLPQYTWTEDFKSGTFAKQIDSFNSHLFDVLCEAIESNPGVTAGWGAGGGHRWRDHLKGYLTRRIRRVSYSKDINELMDRFQIVIPVYLPSKLEEWIKETFAEALDDIGIASNNHEILIPIHKPGMGDGYIPDMSDSTEGNPRYWIVDSVTMWAGLSRKIDEIFEVLWVLALTNNLVSERILDQETGIEDSQEWYEIVASLLLRRVTKLSIQQLGISRVVKDNTGDESGGDTADLNNQPSPIEFVEPEVPEDINPLVIPNERDKYLFTKWLMERPVHIYRGYQYEVHQSYREDNNDNHPPEIMYWREGIDGTSDEWTEWPEGELGFEPIATFRVLPRPKFGDEEEGNDDDDNDDDDGDDKEDAPGERAEVDDAPEEEEEEAAAAPDGPRGLKRRREPSDVTELVGSRDRDDDDDMADAPGTSA
ncbi:hypothetical protein TWF694_010385 [Orbilia ellipsospora]|uniref:Uncharacterized protein n=1 Tax=Orbilia ellipsospora TaxID=2528407 RepID=A0AAV9X9Q3_9PEZI